MMFSHGNLLAFAPFIPLISAVPFPNPPPITKRCQKSIFPTIIQAINESSPSTSYPNTFNTNGQTTIYQNQKDNNPIDRINQIIGFQNIPATAKNCNLNVLFPASYPISAINGKSPPLDIFNLGAPGPLSQLLSQQTQQSSITDNNFPFNWNTPSLFNNSQLLGTTTLNPGSQGVVNQTPFDCSGGQTSENDQGQTQQGVQERGCKKKKRQLGGVGLSNSTGGGSALGAGGQGQGKMMAFLVQVAKEVQQEAGVNYNWQGLGSASPGLAQGATGNNGIGAQGQNQAGLTYNIQPGLASGAGASGATGQQGLPTGLDKRQIPGGFNLPAGFNIPGGLTGGAGGAGGAGLGQFGGAGAGQFGGASGFGGGSGFGAGGIPGVGGTGGVGSGVGGGSGIGANFPGGFNLGGLGGSGAGGNQLGGLGGGAGGQLGGLGGGAGGSQFGSLGGSGAGGNQLGGLGGGAGGNQLGGLGGSGGINYGALLSRLNATGLPAGSNGRGGFAPGGLPANLAQMLQGSGLLGGNAASGAAGANPAARPGLGSSGGGASSSFGGLSGSGNIPGIGGTGSRGAPASIPAPTPIAGNRKRQDGAEPSIFGAGDVPTIPGAETPESSGSDLGGSADTGSASGIGGLGNGNAAGNGVQGLPGFFLTYDC